MIVPSRKHLRLANCVETILEVQGALDVETLDPGLHRRIQGLESTLQAIEIVEVPETDVRRVEEATNRLLQEMRELFSGQAEVRIFQGAMH
ncbi:MAG: hypothetical protein KKB20_17110 [Proteobacteria bacterium]|nr:hypothetical protein [Pseudomonadota bacterium]